MVRKNISLTYRLIVWGGGKNIAYLIHPDLSQAELLSDEFEDFDEYE